MENNNEHNIKKGHFDAFVHAVGSEIEQAQVRLITAANAQMLFHYWKMGNYILYHQNLHGWGGKIIKKLAQAIRFNYPEKKGYSERNLTYMCQFARLYPLNVLRSFIETDSILSVPNIQNITNEVLKLNSGQFTQELTAQIQSADNQSLEITQEVPAQFQNVEKTVATIYKIKIEDIEDLFLASPIARINWASHMVILNNPLPLGVRYWETGKVSCTYSGLEADSEYSWYGKATNSDGEEFYTNANTFKTLKVLAQPTIKAGKTYTVGKFKYKVKSTKKGITKVAISGKNKKIKKLVIPSFVKIKGKKCRVTEINANGFKGYKKLKTVAIKSKYLTKIGTKAFYKCSNLKTVKYYKNKKIKVGRKAFAGCKKLKKKFPARAF